MTAKPSIKSKHCQECSPHASLTGFRSGSAPIRMILLLKAIGGTRHESVSAGVAHVSPGYFSTLGIALVSGRDFSPQDSASSQPVVIVNQTLAKRYWPNQSPLGKRIQVEENSATVIGVVRTAHYSI